MSFQDVRLKIKTLQNTLDEETAARMRFTQPSTGYQFNDSKTALISRAAEQRNNRRPDLPKGTRQALDVAGETTETLHDSLLSEEDARTYTAMKKARESMAAARRNAEKLSKKDNIEMQREAAKRQARTEEHFSKIERAQLETTLSRSDKDRLLAANLARAKRLAEETKRNAEPVVLTADEIFEENTRKAIDECLRHTKDELLHKLNKKLAQVAADVTLAEENLAAAQPTLNPRMGELAPSVLGDMMRGGSSAERHWADRLAENQQHYQWIRRQALRRIEELTFKDKRK